jgi:hypothetical protein
MIAKRHGEIFKVRNSIRNVHDKSAAMLSNVVAIKFVFTDSEMNQGGE